MVTEILDIDFSDDGEHDWLWIEKTAANTAWVAKQLAAHGAAVASAHATVSRRCRIIRWDPPTRDNP